MRIVTRTGRRRPGVPWSGPVLACACALLALGALPLSAYAEPATGSRARTADRSGQAPVTAPTYRITVARSANGGILPSRPAPVPRGGIARFAIFPRTGFHLDS